VEVLAFPTNASHAANSADFSTIGVWSGLRVVHDGVVSVNG